VSEWVVDYRHISIVKGQLGTWEFCTDVTGWEYRAK